jgi:hypothetical protein
MYKMADTPEEENGENKVEEKNDDDSAEYDDSNIDNDDDLEDTDDNRTWKQNKAKIKALYNVKGFSQNLVNYSNNLILFYEKKISTVKELIERKSSDDKKNFVGDITIQDEQKKGIGKMLWDDPSTKKMSDDEKLSLISGYYNEIGSQAEEIMEKDYNDRNRTIKYLLLIREYEANIESIQNAIPKDIIQYDKSDLDESDYASVLDSLTFGGGEKKIMRGGAIPELNDHYTLLVEGYKNTINSPINDTELQTYLIQYIDKLQFLIADPANVDTVQFKEVCQLLLDRINFLKQNQNGGQNGGGPEDDVNSDEEEEEEEEEKKEEKEGEDGSSSSSSSSSSNESKDPSDPNNPLHGQWTELQDAKKKKADDFIKWGDETTTLLSTSIQVANGITQIQNGTLAGPPKYEDKKAETEQVTNAQLDLIKAQTKTFFDSFTKQTDELTADVLKQKELAAQFLIDIKAKEGKELQLDADNSLLDQEEITNSDKEKKNEDFIELFKTAKSQKFVSYNKKREFESNHDMFVRKYITPNYVKKNLYEFMNQCRLLDSVPSWRAKISTLIVGYLTSYVSDPNDTSKHINVIPSYDYFNLVLQGTPGVGKSYSSAIIGKALKWCGFLTVGKMKEIKKPDIVGSYTGQTAPKVYNELTQGLGNVVFIDEAYSIAGAKDETKGTFNEFGQEALDAITDYTSEHIGLLAFIVAGYEYEMQNQFLNVNIGLPRRFPTVLTLRRYDMKSFWKILEMPIIKFCLKYQVDHQHHACFELLNIMFNFQWTPNPVLQISKKWSEWWEGYTLKNLIMNLKVNMCEEIINIPFTKLSNFDEKIKDIENKNITSTSVDVLPLTKLIGDEINMETATFIKAYFIYKFCNIRNGDFFRNQADNLTKFGQTILSDKIINPSGLFKLDQDDKNKKGNTTWIEYIYFNLYFTKNPNKSVENIKFSFQTPAQELESETTFVNEAESKGGSKIKQYTKKNIKEKKYTRKNTGKKNKKTIHKYQNKKNKKTIRQRGGDIDNDIEVVMSYYKNPKIDKDKLERKTFEINKYIKKSNPGETDSLLKIKNLVDDKFKEIEKFDEEIEKLPESEDKNVNISKMKLYKKNLNSILTNIKEYAKLPVDAENLHVDAENTPVVAQTDTLDENEATKNPVDKDLVFDIVGIDFSAFRDTPEITETIVRNKMLDNLINKKEAENEKLKTIFVTFMNKYDEYLSVFSTNRPMTPNQKTDLPIFVYTYLLLGCYNIAFRESRVPLGKFNNDSWWFFTAGDFKIIANYLNIEIIMDNFNKLISKESSNLEVIPEKIVVDNSEAKRKRAEKAAEARIATATAQEAEAAAQEAEAETKAEAETEIKAQEAAAQEAELKAAAEAKTKAEPKAAIVAETKAADQSDFLSEGGKDFTPLHI